MSDKTEKNLPECGASGNISSNSQNSSSVYPKMLTVSSSPHIKYKDNVRTIMTDVIIALLPAYGWGIYVFGWRALTLGVISILCCVLFEALTEKILKRPITVSDGSAIVTGLLLTMNLPVTVPLWMPAVGALFAIVIVKQIFGGIGKNVVNPALAARVFLFSSWPSKMAGFVLPFSMISPLAVNPSGYDAVVSATPLASIKTGVIPSSASLSDMFFGLTGGSIGEVSAFLLIVGGLYLLLKRVISWHIPVAYIATVAMLTMLFPKTAITSDLIAMQFMAYEILSGGLMLGAIFMATDYVTAPVTRTGKLIYGVGCGAITVFLRYYGGYPEGVSFAILIMNLTVWYLDKFTRPKRFGEVKKTKNAKNKPKPAEAK